MGYAVLDPADIERQDHPAREATLRSISDAVGLSNLGVHVYEAAPGEQLPLAYHSHDEQEELFYVLAGTLSVETPEETVTVDAGEVFAVGPESPHRAFDDADAGAPVRVLAIGAPPVDDVNVYEP